MEKILTYIAIAVLMPVVAMAQHVEERSRYLVPTPYDGLHGQIDSIVLTTYKVKESVDTRELFGAKEGGKELDFLKGEATEVTFISFDKHGHFTRRIESKINDEGILELNSKWEVARDENSLPTHIIFRTPTDGAITDFSLVERRDGKEIYRTPRQKGIPAVSSRVEQIVEFAGDTITTTRIYPVGYQTRYTFIYNNKGQNIFWTDKMDGEDNYVAFFSTYTPEGFLEQTERKVFDIDKRKESLSSDKIINYMHYRYEKEPVAHLPNWTQRLMVDENKVPVGLEVQKIYYRKAANNPLIPQGDF